jgi:hypothetical protein
MRRAARRDAARGACWLLAAALLLLSASMLHAREEPPPGGDTGSASAPHVAARAPPACALLVFRHGQKTGGTTLRNFFRQQEATGDWEFYRHGRTLHDAMPGVSTPSAFAALTSGRAAATHGHSPQGDRNWPEVSNRKRLELLLSFWEVRWHAVATTAGCLNASLSAKCRRWSRPPPTSRARRGA